MGNILDSIVYTKKLEVAQAKELYPANDLINQIEHLNTEKYSLVGALRSNPGIIAEFKRASPSKGSINANGSVAEIVQGYEHNGAAGISILTDQTYFKAKKDDFALGRACSTKPILRKEFIIDKYQIFESKVMGANVILLIAAILTKQQILNFTDIAHQLDLEVLIELHSPTETDKLCGKEDLIGINNRNLKTFEVDINQAIYIREMIGGNTSTPFIAESGLSSINEIELLLTKGFSGFLMGEYFMKQDEPIKAFDQFNKQLKQLV